MAEAPVPASVPSRFGRRRVPRPRRLGTTALAALGTSVLLSLLLVSFAWRGERDRTDLIGRFRPPSGSAILGTDQFGRDVFRLIVAGLPLTVGLAVVTVALSALLGALIAVCALGGRRRLVVLASISDVLLAIPLFVVALVLASSRGPGKATAVLTLVGLGWTPYFRMIIALMISLRTELWIEAAVVGGATPLRVITRHLLPHVVAPVRALCAARVGHAILAVSGLSFLGIGDKPPSAEWGALLAGAQPHLERAPWTVAGPSLAIVAATLTAVLGARRLP
jgi:peptide/nickel transport system permease protein